MSTTAAAASDRARASTLAGEDGVSFPTIPPARVPVLNAIYRRRRAFPATIAGRQATILPAWRPFDGQASASRRLLLKIDGADAELSIARLLLDLLISSVDPALPLDKLQPDHAAIVLEFALTDLLDALEASFGWSLTIVSILSPRAKPDGADPPALTFVVMVEGLGTSACELRLAHDQALKLAKHLDQYPGLEPASIDVPMTACLRQAIATLSVGEIRTLSPGDVVIVEEACRSSASAIAVIAEHLVVPVELTPSGGLLSSNPIRGRGSPWEWSMEKAPDISQPSAQDASDLDDLPVRLVFEVGRLELSLGEIRRLAPGTVLPLARPIEGALDIVANGRRIGRGTIVKIGDSIGVRVMRLLDNA